MKEEEIATYVDTAGKAFGGEFELEVKVIDTFGQSSLSTKHNLILEERNESIAEIAPSLLALAGTHCCTVVLVCITWRIWVFEDLGIAMQRYDEVGDSQRLDDFDNDGAADYVAGGVLAMGIVGLNVELGVVAGFGGQGHLQPRQERSAGLGRVRSNGCARLPGSHNPCVAHILRLPARSRGWAGATRGGGVRISATAAGVAGVDGVARVAASVEVGRRRVDAHLSQVSRGG